MVVAATLVGVALIGTGVIVGLLSGGPPLHRALRQLLIGYGAASVTYLLGLLPGCPRRPKRYGSTGIRAPEAKKQKLDSALIDAYPDPIAVTDIENYVEEDR